MHGSLTGDRPGWAGSESASESESGHTATRLVRQHLEAVQRCPSSLLFLHLSLAAIRHGAEVRRLFPVPQRCAELQFRPLKSSFAAAPTGKCSSS